MLVGLFGVRRRGVTVAGGLVGSEARVEGFSARDGWACASWLWRIDSGIGDVGGVGQMQGLRGLETVTVRRWPRGEISETVVPRDPQCQDLLIRKKHHGGSPTGSLQVRPPHPTTPPSCHPITLSVADTCV